MLEIVHKQGDEWHFLLDVLVIHWRYTNNGLAWREKKCATAHHNWLVINEVLGNLRLLEDILISADLHADKVQLVGVFPAATHLTITSREQLSDRLDVIGEGRV